MITPYNDEFTLRRQLDQTINHASGVNAVVDEVAQDHDCIFGLGLDGCEYCRESGKAAMDVSYGDGAGS